ncbi:MAG: hypothetical protein K0R65_1604 [Crocinitomicaceae bacterium]|jgi:hypothetical protein|nr:hypothetical protein [Crocinitomicaceae bacterium]
MSTDIQEKLIDAIKDKIQGEDSLGKALADVLNLSLDAVYRRCRGETAFTIFEVRKLCSHYGISFDALMDVRSDHVVFSYNSLSEYDFSLDRYLESILEGVKAVKNLPGATLTLTVKDTPLFQFLNFPHLLRFKLYFWAKSFLNVEEYKNAQFGYEKISEKTFQTGKEILQVYNMIPSKEIYDFDFLRGFIRQIQYYFDAYLFKDPNYALKLLNEMQELLNHMKAQISIGKKFMYGTHPPASGNEYEVYLNQTIITDSTYCFHSEAGSGLYLTHNMMNFLHTKDLNYVGESEQILHKLLENSSLISKVNEKERNAFFYKLERSIQLCKQKIEAELTI